MRRIENLHVSGLSPLVTPRELKAEFPLPDSVRDIVIDGREAVQKILDRQDRRLLALVGPCSIHDPAAALEYARRLKPVRDAVRDQLCVIMRVYFEKPRTVIGWKGLIYDPHLDGSSDMNEGLRRARRVLLDICGLGLPVATEVLDPFVPQYIADLVSWAAIGARTTESQTHRQMASGLSMPVGFKNRTDGNIQVAIEAMEAARHEHAFVGMDEDGHVCIVKTTGNRWGHIVLRGGRSRSNYDADSIREAAEAMRQAGLEPLIMVDCSHGNTGKKFELQEKVWNSVILQRQGGNDALIGLQLESNLVEGSQKLSGDLARLRHGVSITDPCLGWEATERILRQSAEALRGGRSPGKEEGRGQPSEIRGAP